MLDLAFLAVAIFVVVKASKGEYHETACNIAMVVGIIAGVVGCITGIGKNDFTFLVLNILVMFFAFGLRFAARHLAKLYIEKQIAYQEEVDREIRKYTRFPDKPTVYTDENFDDEELRFGKGGYTDTTKVSLEKTDIYIGDNFGDVEPLFGKSVYTVKTKVSLEKKEIPVEKTKVSLKKRDIYTNDDPDDK